MQKIIDDQRMIYRCCSLYYEDNIGQAEIAKYLGISKSSVSRMLQLGRETGIVEIRVHHVTRYMYAELDEQIRERYHLRDVVVSVPQEFPKRKCTFVPVVGGMWAENVQANKVAEAFAQKYPTLKKLDFVTREQIDDYLEKGAVGILSHRFLDKNGNTEPFDEFNRRTAAISSENYRKVKNRILVTGGSGKKDLVEGCIRGGFANILIIDIDCARELSS